MGTKTARTYLSQIEMQGAVLAGLKCSISIDSIGKECLDNTHKILYKYKQCVSIPPLSLIDDIIAVAECSTDSVKVNATIQAKIQGKQLQLGHKKCFQMHIGKSSECCPSLNVHDKVMHTANHERYLGDILTSVCKKIKQYPGQTQQGYGICK